MAVMLMHAGQQAAASAVEIPSRATPSARRYCTNSMSCHRRCLRCRHCHCWNHALRLIKQHWKEASEGSNRLAAVVVDWTPPHVWSYWIQQVLLPPFEQPHHSLEQQQQQQQQRQRQQRQQLQLHSRRLGPTLHQRSQRKPTQVTPHEAVVNRSEGGKKARTT